MDDENHDIPKKGIKALIFDWFTTQKFKNLIIQFRFKLSV